MSITLSQQSMVRPRAHRASAELLRECDCGQPLDCCQTRHCPRCGVTLPR